MIPRGPFQPRLFCDSVILCFCLLAEEEAEPTHITISPLASAFGGLQRYFWSELVLAASFPWSLAASSPALVPP